MGSQFNSLRTGLRGLDSVRLSPPEYGSSGQMHLVQVRPRHDGYNRIAVGQPVADDSKGDCICDRLLHSPSYVGKTSYVVVRGLADVHIVLVERQ